MGGEKRVPEWDLGVSFPDPEHHGGPGLQWLLWSGEQGPSLPLGGQPRVPIRYVPVLPMGGTAGEPERVPGQDMLLQASGPQNAGRRARLTPAPAEGLSAIGMFSALLS